MSLQYDDFCGFRTNFELNEETFSIYNNSLISVVISVVLFIIVSTENTYIEGWSHVDVKKNNLFLDSSKSVGDVEHKGPLVIASNAGE